MPKPGQKNNKPEKISIDLAEKLSHSSVAILVALLSKHDQEEREKEQQKDNIKHRNGVISSGIHQVRLSAAGGEINVELKQDLVRYRRKKDPNAVRYAVKSELLGKGSSGKVFSSKQSLFVNGSSVSIKQKSLDKERVIKLQAHSRDRVSGKLYAENECEMSRQGAPDLHVKELVYRDEKKKSALIMHRVQGEDFYDVIDRDYSETENWSSLYRIRLCLKMAKALQKVHEYEVVHNDLKYENGMLTNRIDKDTPGEFSWIDFAYAMKTGTDNTGLGYGTLGFAAPEMVNGKGSTPISDVYSLAYMMRLIWRADVGGKYDHATKAPEIYVGPEAITGLFRNIYDLGSSEEAQIRTLLVGMLAKDPANRTTLNNAIAQLEALEKNHLARLAVSENQGQVFSTARPK